MNDNEQEKIEKKAAGQKTAHVAGRTASAYFGGGLGVRAYDMASKTKVGQTLENGVGNTISKMPVVGNLNKKINDTGLIDTADKIADVSAGKFGNRKNDLNNRFNSGNIRKNDNNKNKDLNSHNELKSSFNKKNNNDNIPNALKNSSNSHTKVASYAMNIIQNRKEKKEHNESIEETNDKQVDEFTDNEEQQEQKIQHILKKLMPIIMMLIPILLIAVVVIASISPVVTIYQRFISLFHHKDADASSYMMYSEKEQQNYQAEIDYNNAILGSADGSVKGIIAEYQEKYGVTIDWYLLNALITYRYTSDPNDLYSNDDSGDLDEEEINQKLDDLNNSTSDESSNEGSEESDNSNTSVDYSYAKKKIKSFATLMVVKNGDTYVTDKEKDGVVYNNVLNSATFKKYYQKMLVDDTEEERRKLLDMIYEFADDARKMLEETGESTSGGVVSGSSVIHLQTCKQAYATKNINGVTVYDNPPWNEGTEYPDYLDIKDYLKGVLSREIGVSNDYKEAMKAQAIAALSFLINDSRSGFNLKSGEMYFPSGTCRQATCSPTYGCTSVVESTSSSPVLHTFYAGQNRFSGGSSYGPINESENAILEEVLNNVFGKIMVNKGVTSASFSGSGDTISANYLDSCNAGKCFSQQGAINDAKSGMTYEQILAKYYSSYSYDIIDIQEGLYFTSGGNYNGTSVLNENYHYHQGDSEWASLTLCGSGEIKSNGCNITSTAMVISVLKNERITPAILQSRQGSIAACSPSSRPQMIMKVFI